MQYGLFESEVLDHGIRQELLAHPSYRGARYLSAVGIYIDGYEPANADIRDGVEAECPERTRYGRTLWIEDSGTWDYLNRDAV